MTFAQSRWLWLSRNFSRLTLEKLCEGFTLILHFICIDGSSMKTGKWSLMSVMITPLLISWVTELVRMWSMSDMDWFWILVTFSMHWRKLLSLIVVRYWLHEVFMRLMFESRQMKDVIAQICNTYYYSVLGIRRSCTDSAVHGCACAYEGVNDCTTSSLWIPVYSILYSMLGKSKTKGETINTVYLLYIYSAILYSTAL